MTSASVMYDEFEKSIKVNQIVAYVCWDNVGF